MSFKEKLAALIAIQHFVTEITGDDHVTPETYHAVGEVINREFAPSEVEGKADVEELIEILLSIINTLTAEVLA
jgi:hypothetical protein